jgi:ribokinase
MVTPGVASGVAPIFVDNGGQNRILVVKGANDCLLPPDIDAAADLLRQADCVILQLEIPRQTVYYTLRIAHQLGIRAILNPAPGQALDFAELAHAEYVIPNETEAEALTGMPVTTLGEARSSAIHLLRSGVRRAIITLGANGALCASHESVEHVSGYRVDSVDTTGAGDAFIGSFACFLASGCAEAEAVKRANVYAALSTLGVGTQMSFATLDRFEAEWQKHSG